MLIKTFNIKNVPNCNFGRLQPHQVLPTGWGGNVYLNKMKKIVKYLKLQHLVNNLKRGCLQYISS